MSPQRKGTGVILQLMKARHFFTLFAVALAHESKGHVHRLRSERTNVQRVEAAMDS